MALPATSRKSALGTIELMLPVYAPVRWVTPIRMDNLPF